MMGSNLKEPVNKAAASIHRTVQHSLISFCNNHTAINPKTGILNNVKEQMSTKEREKKLPCSLVKKCYKGQCGDGSNKSCVNAYQLHTQNLTTTLKLDPVTLKSSGGSVALRYFIF